LWLVIGFAVLGEQVAVHLVARRLLKLPLILHLSSRRHTSEPRGQRHVRRRTREGHHRERERNESFVAAPNPNLPIRNEQIAPGVARTTHERDPRRCVWSHSSGPFSSPRVEGCGRREEGRHLLAQVEVELRHHEAVPVASQRRRAARVGRGEVAAAVKVPQVLVRRLPVAAGEGVGKALCARKG
jgi:hypothetical protein